MISILFGLGLSANVYATLPADYTDLSNEQKQDVLWRNVEMSHQQNPLPEMGKGGFWDAWEKLKGLFKLAPSFDHDSDEMPEGRTKIIHATGSVARVSFVPASGHPFTGIYSTGDVGLARLSLAVAPSDTSFVPGMALKFFVPNHASVNLHVMNALDGQGADWNYFAMPFSNKIEHPSGWVLRAIEKIFEWTRKPANDLPVSHLASWDNDGHEVLHPVYPERLYFKPSESVAGLIPSDSREDFRLSLESVPYGPLYEVYGEFKGLEYHIGTLMLDSNILASAYGDKTVFFQHQR
jgi:hypothetical protein